HAARPSTAAVIRSVRSFRERWAAAGDRLRRRECQRPKTSSAARVAICSGGWPDESPTEQLLSENVPGLIVDSGVAVAVRLGVGVWLAVLSPVGEALGVSVGVSLGVPLAVGVEVDVGVSVIVGVGVGGGALLNSTVSDPSLLAVTTSSMP